MKNLFGILWESFFFLVYRHVVKACNQSFFSVHFCPCFQPYDSSYTLIELAVQSNMTHCVCVIDLVAIHQNYVHNIFKFIILAALLNL